VAKPKYFFLGCTRRRAVLSHMEETDVKRYDYCNPCTSLHEQLAWRAYVNISS